MRNTLGIVPLKMDCFAWLKCNLNMACLVSGALSARIMMTYTSRNVLPLREPPYNRLYLAPDDSIFVAVIWSGVFENVMVIPSVRGGLHP